RSAARVWTRPRLDGYPLLVSKEILNPADLIASDLVHVMCAARGLNEFLENALPPVTRAFGADRVMLIDYRDNTKRFDLLHFGGYHKQSRFDLQRGLPFMELDKAFSQTTAYFADGNRKRLYVPLYFSTTLEALIVFESDTAIELTTQRV